MHEETTERLQIYGGRIGMWVPILVMLVGVVLYTLADMVSIKSFWVANFCGLLVAYALTKRKKTFGDMLIRNLKNDVFPTLCLCFVLAGILSYVLRQSGLVNGMLWLCTSVNLNAQWIPFITYFVSAIIAVSCGTSSGTVTAVTPIIFPVALAFGCNPPLVLGAIISGAIMGDNFSPISDTTVTSVSVMNATMSEVIKERIKYTFSAVAIASVLFIVFGHTTISASGVLQPEISSEYARTCVMLIVPVILIVLVMRGIDLVSSLIICIVMGTVISLGMGFFSLHDLVLESGPIISGINGMSGIIIFVLLAFCLVGFTKEAGAFDDLLNSVARICKKAWQVEVACILTIMLAVGCCATTTPAMIMTGSLVKQLYADFDIDRRRAANVLDAITCSTAGILPYTTGVMLMCTLAREYTTDFSIISVSMFSFHSIALVGIYLLCAFTGLFRKKDSEVYKG